MSSMLAILVLSLISGLEAGGEAAAPWPSFRGPGASGVADGHALPVRWDLESRENVRWKTRIPGLGHSSPVVWGERLFVTSAVREDGEADLKVGLYGDIQPLVEEVRHEWRVDCLDASTGKIRWQRTAHAGVPAIRRHPKSSHASSTPATDGRRVVVFFGSEGLFAYSAEGELAWRKDLGTLDAGYFRVPSAQWGFGSSPVIHGDKVIVQCDVQKDSFIAAYALQDGREVWRTPRKDVPTWSTPAVHAAGKRPQVIANGYHHIGGYDLATGKELWNLRGGGDIPVPTPIVWEDLVFVTNAHGGKAPIYAIRLDAEGSIEPAGGEREHESIAWSYERGGNYMQTPLVYRGRLYCSSDSGVLTAYDARSGRRLFQERVGRGRTGFTASPVAGDGKLYLTSEDGDVHVLAAKDEYELLATNGLGETCMATPAISGGTLFFRTRGHVVAVGR